MYFVKSKKTFSVIISLWMKWNYRKKTYNDLDKAIYGIKSEPKPLALYLFTSCKKTEKKVLLELSAGD